jgi:predicted metalloprotease with PDZ domain
VTTRNDAGRLVIAQVRRDTAGDKAGLNVDDEIIAIDDFRIRADRWDNRLEQYRPGDRVTVLVARREQLLRIPVVFAAEEPRGWRLEPAPGAAAAKTERLNSYLRPPAA